MEAADGQVANGRPRCAMGITWCTGSTAARPTWTTWCCYGACCRTRRERRQYRRPQFSLTSQQEVAHLMGSKAVEPKLYLSFSMEEAVLANNILRRLVVAFACGYICCVTA